ncbi:MAG: molybdenum cofactor guanylyltransferase [Candidatus Bathyarchaeota archaeon]|nr:molybdenum cofactor guanylyltransferase [Candidatus Termiticorpusculum sp.]
MSRRVALVLSGGKAHRFQSQQQSWQDKALTLLADKPLLVHAIENIARVVDEVIVCVNNEERKTRYLEVLEKHNLRVKIVIDEKTPIGGPNVAILTGLKAAQADLCLIVPSDMPFVKPEVANYLFNLSEDFEVVVPMWPNGQLETLTMILHHSIGLEIVQTLCQLKRSHVDDIPRAASKTLLVSPMETIKILDSQLKSFININFQEDLKTLQTRSLQGPIQENIQLYQNGFFASDLQLMCDAAKMCQEGNFMMAQKKFDLCKCRFETCGNFFWAALASEGKGEAMLQQIQLQKENLSQTTLTFDSETKKTFLDAVNNYDHEAKIYKKNCCMRLLERALTDKARCESKIID